MLPDLSAAHIFVLVVVALIVVGPKDLPGLLRKIGQFMSKLRGLASEFRSSFDEMARQSELDDLRKEVEAMRASAGKPVEELKGHINDIMQDQTIATAFDHSNFPTTVEAAPSAEPQPSILPPKAKSGPKTKAKASGKSAPKTSASKAAASKPSAAKTAAPKASASKGAAPKTGAKKAKA